MSDYQKPNDFTLDRIDLVLDSGDTVSLFDMFVSIDFFQDIFGGAMFCEIFISDALDLYSSLPIKNNEILEIEFSSPGNEKIQKTMLLYSREEVILKESGNVTYYKLRFVSTATLRNINIRSSRSYTGTVSDIAGSIWSDHFSDLSPIAREQSNGEYTLVLPYNTPFAHIDFLTKKATRQTNNNHCDFLFYEDFKGFKFVSIGNMIEQPSRGYFVWELPEASPLSKRDNGGVDIYGSRARIQEVVFLGKENLIDETVSGMYTGFVNQHDLVNKTIKGTKYRYQDAFPETTHLNPNPLTIPSISSNIGLLSSYHSKFAGVFPPDTIIKRKSQINSLLNKRLRFVTAGSSSINAGDKIKLDFTKQSPIQLDVDRLDKYRTGYYIVSSVKHTISKANGYTMTVEACTDSYGTPLPTESRFDSKQVQGG